VECAHGRHQADAWRAAWSGAEGRAQVGHRPAGELVDRAAGDGRPQLRLVEDEIAEYNAKKIAAVTKNIAERS